MDATEDDHVGIGAGCGLGETQRITSKISHILDFGHLVVMGEDDGLPFLF